MIPGEIITKDGEIELNAGQPTVTLDVANTGDRPIQVGSHYHFYETNAALRFDRDKTRGMRLDIAAGSAVRFEPGQTRTVTLVPYRGDRLVFGFNQKVMGELERIRALRLACRSPYHSQIVNVRSIVISENRHGCSRQGDLEGSDHASGDDAGGVRDRARRPDSLLPGPAIPISRPSSFGT